MKLFEKLRWLPIEMPLPRHRRCLGEQLRAADVRRGHAWHEQRQVEKVAPVHRQARRPRPATPCPAIWLRAASRTVDSPTTSTVAATPASERVIGSSNADPTVTCTARVASVNPGMRIVTS